MVMLLDCCDVSLVVTTLYQLQLCAGFGDLASNLSTALFIYQDGIWSEKFWIFCSTTVRTSEVGLPYTAHESGHFPLTDNKTQGTSVKQGVKKEDF
jgi:hypothetical protein